MAESNSTDRAVLFADITGSTRLYSQIGDVAARRLVADCLDQWTAIVEGNSGKVVQLRGGVITRSSSASTGNFFCKIRVLTALMSGTMEVLTMSS